MSATKTTTKVVLVDDNPFILELLRGGIDPLAEVAAFRNPEDALAHCQKDQPDLVICDFRMPSIDGVQLVRKLKALSGADHVRFLIMAAKADVDDTLRPLSDLVEEFVVKPFFVKELARQAKNILD